jgi:uncharacterized protein YbjQ (UPF0145 family)
MDLTFTWDDKTIPWLADTDEWTAAELREVEALARGELSQLSITSIRGLMIGVSVARALGVRIADADRQLTFGRINSIRDELAAQHDENDERAAARAAELAAQADAAVAPPTGRVVEFTGEATIPVTAIEAPTGQVSPGGAALFPGSAEEVPPPA